MKERERERKKERNIKEGKYPFPFVMCVKHDKIQNSNEGDNKFASIFLSFFFVK